MLFRPLSVLFLVETDLGLVSLSFLALRWDAERTRHAESHMARRPMEPETETVRILQTGGSFPTSCHAQRTKTPMRFSQVLVYTPNLAVPVSNALVYITGRPPEGIPDGVYCPDCVPLDCPNEDAILTAADGSFSLSTESGTGKYLVVQKGQFLRISPVDIEVGDTALDIALTSLPGQWNPDGGEWTPRIAVAAGEFDRLEDALGKLGLGETDIVNWEERLVGGTAKFAFYENGYAVSGDGHTSLGTLADLVSDPAELAKYHIIFIPCGNGVVDGVLTPENIQNIRDWVEAGGRWYVADWSGEFIDQVFPEYQTFYKDGGGSLDLESYDAIGTSTDAALMAWLDAIPEGLKDINPLNDENDHPTLTHLPGIPTVDNWSGIESTPYVIVNDPVYGAVNLGHRTWLETTTGNFGEIPSGTSHPLTVTAQYGCGRLQFTSYHAAEFENYVGLSPQELVLIDTILEIGMCVPAPPT